MSYYLKYLVLLVVFLPCHTLCPEKECGDPTFTYEYQGCIEQFYRMYTYNGDNCPCFTDFIEK